MGEKTITSRKKKQYTVSRDSYKVLSSVYKNRLHDTHLLFHLRHIWIFQHSYKKVWAFDSRLIPPEYSGFNKKSEVMMSNRSQKNEAFSNSPLIQTLIHINYSKKQQQKNRMRNVRATVWLRQHQIRMKMNEMNQNWY